MGDGSNRGFKRVVNAFFYSMAGFKAAWKNEAAFRQEIIAGIIFVPAGFFIGKTGSQKAILIGSYLIIPLVELLNSAIEATVDRFGMERNELSGRAKDIGSASVFLSICIAAIVWMLILWERFFSV
ncbi:MAG: diacylglycerol kinase [Deltaproteobacteria bacterium]|nr:diacylglycerol kinase [Deltaproteobacteria bacterium]